jgi:hypothetical protein
VTDKKLTKEVEDALIEQGWRIEQRGGHKIAYSPDGTTRPIPISTSPSDRRAFENLVHQLKRGGFIWPWNAEARRNFQKGGK